MQSFSEQDKLTEKLLSSKSNKKCMNTNLTSHYSRACVAIGDNLFVVGGQEGDFMPKPGSPIFKCSRRHEVSYIFFQESLSS